jgi:hypothetical protein
MECEFATGVAAADAPQTAMDPTRRNCASKNLLLHERCNLSADPRLSRIGSDLGFL